MQNNKEKTAKKRLPSWLYTFFRLFTGTPAREMTIADERYDSPSKLAVKRFFRKPLATAAVIILAFMFIFVLVGPLFVLDSAEED